MGGAAPKMKLRPLSERDQARSDAQRIQMFSIPEQDEFKKLVRRRRFVKSVTFKDKKVPDLTVRTVMIVKTKTDLVLTVIRDPQKPENVYTADTGATTHTAPTVIDAVLMAHKALQAEVTANGGPTDKHTAHLNAWAPPYPHWTPDEIEDPYAALVALKEFLVIKAGEASYGSMGLAYAVNKVMAQHKR